MAYKETFGFLLAETARGWRTRLDQRLRQLGLSQSKWLALLHLKKANTDLTQKELSELLGIESPSTVRLLDRMEADGWVERRASPTDRRSKTVHLNAKAEEVIREIKQIGNKLHNELLDSVTPEELECAIRVLQRIKERAEAL